VSVSAGLALASFAQASDAPTNTKLKWRARGTSVQQAVATSEPSETKPGPARKAVTEQPGAISTKTSRARLRDSVMQVANYQDDPQGSQDLDDLKDSQDAHRRIDEDLDKLEADNMPPDIKSEPAESEPIPEPAPLREADDPFREDAVPTPPANDEPLPPGDLSQGISTPGFSQSCDDYQIECRRAFQELQSHGMKDIVVGLVIEGVEGEDYPCDCKPQNPPRFAGRNFSPTTFTWKATGVCHKPLYFEDVQLERYGHSWNPVVQPFMSAAHFFVSIPVLPYKMGLTPPNECIYTLGYYRPGSCAPYMLDPIPLSLRGAVFEAIGITGFAFFFYPPG